MSNKTLLAVIGSNVNYSLSPFIHQKFIKQHNLLGYYVPLSLKEEDFNKQNILNLFNKFNFKGFNVTYPYKHKVFNIVDVKDKSLQEIGALNTIYFNRQTKQICAQNFDGIGCYLSFKEYLKIDLTNKKILFIGFGSTTKAILHSFNKNNVTNITVSNRTEEKLTNYLKTGSLKFLTLGFNNLSKSIKNYDIVINTTNIPLYEIIDLTKANKTLFYDINYSSKIYSKMLEFNSVGIRYQDGIPMLCYQAMFGFEKWFNVLPVVDESLIKEVYNNVNSWFNRSYCKW